MYIDSRDNACSLSYRMQNNFILSGIQFAITIMCQTMSDMQTMRLFIYLREFDEEYPWLG